MCKKCYPEYQADEFTVNRSRYRSEVCKRRMVIPQTESKYFCKL